MPQQKWKSAEAKRNAIKLAEDWETLKAKHAPVKPVVKRNLKRKPVMVSNPRVAEMRATPSLDTGVTGAVKSGSSVPKVYTGDKIVGIATMHKSNMVPIFSEEGAKDVAKMRR